MRSSGQQIVANLSAELITGVISVAISISLTALIFSGPLANYLPVGLGMVLLGGIVMRLVMILGSDLVVPLATSLVEQLVLVAGASAAIQQAFISLAPDRLFVTLVAGIIAVSLLTGVILLVVGFTKAAEVIQRMPQSVILGFMA